MARPKDKESLLQQSQINFDKLQALVMNMGEAAETLTFAPGSLNRNVRDVLAHLHHWHTMMLTWHEIGMSGNKPSMPAPGYTWKTVPDLNKVINQQYASTPLSEVQSLLQTSYQQLRLLIEQHTDEELFTKKKYKWTGSTSLGAYLISATSSHYDWALKLIKKSTAVKG